MAGEIKTIPNITPSQYVQIIKANQEKELFDMQKLKPDADRIKQKEGPKLREAATKGDVKTQDASGVVGERSKAAVGMELLSDGLKKLADVAKSAQMDNGKAIDALMIKPEKVGEEIGKQNKLTTIFKGDLAETLRAILQQNPQRSDIKNAVVDVLRAYALLYETTPETMPVKTTQMNVALLQLMELLDGGDALLNKALNELKDLKPEVPKMIDAQLGQNKTTQNESSIGKIISLLVDTMETGDKNQILKEIGNQVIRGLLTPNTLKSPMYHFVIPVQSGEVQAFGELWIKPKNGEDVDENKHGNGDGGKDVLKMSLSIDIPEVGKFDMDISVLDTQLNATFYCPGELIEKFQDAEEVIGLAARNAGYKTGMIQVSENKRRKVEQILPEMVERRREVDARV